MMNIQEIQKLKTELETNLTDGIRANLQSFKELTGLTLDSVLVDMTTLQAIGLEPENVLDRVRVKLHL